MPQIIEHKVENRPVVTNKMKKRNFNAMHAVY